MIEEIDKTKIRGRWQSSSDGIASGGDDTIQSIGMCADKINELVEEVNKLRELVTPLN